MTDARQSRRASRAPRVGLDPDFDIGRGDVSGRFRPELDAGTCRDQLRRSGVKKLPWREGPKAPQMPARDQRDDLEPRMEAWRTAGARLEAIMVERPQRTPVEPVGTLIGGEAEMMRAGEAGALRASQLGTRTQLDGTAGDLRIVHGSP